MARPWKVAGLVVAVAGLGELGHQLFDHFHWAGHHAFHLLFPVAAVAVFAGLAIADMRRNGRPRFSWRLRPDDPDAEEAG
ncbi:MAG: hypothetical protein WD276_01185 [Actinomycetota bacterium]